MLLLQSQRWNVLGIVLTILVLKSRMKSLVIYSVLRLLTALNICIRNLTVKDLFYAMCYDNYYHMYVLSVQY